jgi:pimeloyl-ACP methyl ester carboxylesterase
MAQAPAFVGYAPAEAGWVSRFISAPDGLRLHVRVYGDPTAAALPVVCLPGLTRNSADFHALAAALAGDAERARRVVAIDSRGRGRSDYDRDPANYTLATELADVIAVLTALEVGPAVFVGTSRGGLLTMLLAAAKPMFIAGAVLNDIGPVIEIEGLLRIKSYVGRLPAPRDFSDAAAMLQRAGGRQFPKLTADDWRVQARRTWRQDGDRLVLDYDPRLSQTLASLDPAAALPTLWPQFDALAGVPVMVIRGANSDILSDATVTTMAARHADLVMLQIPDQGHVPLLDDAATMQAIVAFTGACDAGSRSA